MEYQGGKHLFSAIADPDQFFFYQSQINEAATAHSLPFLTVL